MSAWELSLSRHVLGAELHKLHKPYRGIGALNLLSHSRTTTLKGIIESPEPEAEQAVESNASCLSGLWLRRASASTGQLRTCEMLSSEENLRWSGVREMAQQPIAKNL